MIIHRNLSKVKKEQQSSQPVYKKTIDSLGEFGDTSGMLCLGLRGLL